MGPYSSPYASGAYPYASYPYSNSKDTAPLRKSGTWGSGGTIPTNMNAFDDGGVR